MVIFTLSLPFGPRFLVVFTLSLPFGLQTKGQVKDCASLFRRKSKTKFLGQELCSCTLSRGLYLVFTLRVADQRVGQRPKGLRFAHKNKVFGPKGPKGISELALRAVKEQKNQ